MSFPAVRLRRLRQNPWIREMVAENHITVSDLIWPVFICEGEKQRISVPNMAGVFRLSLDELLVEIEKASNLGIGCMALFPATPIDKKDALGKEALNPHNLVCTAIRLMKKHFPDMGILCDVALDPYTSHGHDGLINEQGYVENDRTIEMLVKQSLLQAEMGCDILAPSDMMDGRIGAIRTALEENGHHNMMLMSYGAKYASSYYGPFRGAIGSAGNLKSDKKTYQMNPANIREAIREIELDIAEGADMVMVKPAMPYLDVISAINQRFNIPVFAYQVSGEYAMLKTAFDGGFLDETKTLLETMLCFKRAGATGILTYFAPTVAKILKEIGE